MSQTSKPNLELEAQLIKIDFQNMLVQWGSDTPLRTGLHASSVLVSDEEWCIREHVLMEFFSQQAVHPESMPWDWRKQMIFENGWDLHRRWQRLFANEANVVHSDQGEGIRPELDLTHYDETREVYFSPDAILEFGGQRYVVEIKGINHDEFAGNPDLYEQEFHNGAYRYKLHKEARKGVKDCDFVEDAMKVSQTVHKAFYQAQLYMHLLELKKAILLIENKNNQEFKVWVIEYDRSKAVKYIQRIYDRKEAVILVRTHGLVKLPARIPACQSRGDERARKCPMREICFSNAMKLEG